MSVRNQALLSVLLLTVFIPAICSANGIDTAPGTTSLPINVEGNNVMTLLSNGTVGIGTTSPADLLDVSGSGNIRIRLAGVNAVTTTQFIQFPGSAGGAFWDTATVGANTYFRTSNNSLLDTTAMTFLSNGNVGIGTTDPGWKLDLSGGRIRVQALTAQDAIPGFGTGIEILYDQLSGNDEGQILSYDRANNVVKPLWIFGSPLALEGGNVGVGSTNPQGTLDVENGSNTATICLNGSCSSSLGSSFSVHINWNGGIFREIPGN